MCGDMKRKLFFLINILFGAVIAYFSAMKVLTLIWLSSFTHADIEKLKFWAYVYLLIFVLSVVFLIYVIKKFNKKS